MTPRQIELVQDSWANVSDSSDHAARLFYLRLFEEQPEVRDLFVTSVSGQESVLSEALDDSIDHLDGDLNNVPALEELARLHTINGISAERYEAVSEAMFWMLEQEIGNLLDDETRDAWQVAYTRLAGRMLGESACEIPAS